MSLLKKLAGLAVGAAAVGAVAYVLQNREHHDDEYEHIWGSEDEVEPETDSAEPADDASAVAEPAPAAAPEEPAAPAEEPKPEEPADAAETPAAKTPDFDAPNVNPVELGHVEVSRTPDGKIDFYFKTRGETRVLAKILEQMDEDGYDGVHPVLISECGNQTAAQLLHHGIEAKWPGAPVKIVPCSGLCSFYAQDQGIIITY